MPRASDARCCRTRRRVVDEPAAANGRRVRRRRNEKQEKRTFSWVASPTRSCSTEPSSFATSRTMADMSSANKKVSFLGLSNVESCPHAVTRYAADITPTHKNTQKRIRSQLVIFSCSVTAKSGSRRVCVRGSLIQSVFGRRGVIHYMARTCRARATAPS